MKKQLFLLFIVYLFLQINNVYAYNSLNINKTKGDVSPDYYEITKLRENNEHINTVYSVRITDVHKEINRLRIERGIKPLSLNMDLITTAGQKGHRMRDLNCWDHYCGGEWDYEIKKAGYLSHRGENLAMVDGNALSVANALYNSIEHRKIMLSDKFTEVGYYMIDFSGGRFMVMHLSTGKHTDVHQYILDKY